MSYSPQSETLPGIVVDANLAVGAVLAISGLEFAPALFARWSEQERPLRAPELWLAEVTSVIRQHVFRGLISLEEAHQAIDDVVGLEVERFPLDIRLYHHALNWAGRIGHSKVYDSLYLALAESLNAEFWTADERLAKTGQATGADWIKWTGDL
jgi:predicted nucleic acid-binding protein